MNILVVGGDGFCGWPTSLELLARGHNVVVVDSLARRAIDFELGVFSLTNIQTIYTRIVEARRAIRGNIFLELIDVYKGSQELLELIRKYEIDTIIHYGEIKSAPYSMIDPYHMRKTVDHNINTTINILTAILESKKDIHLVHLGTMGVYGYKDDFGEIPEGYLDIVVKATGAPASILFPTDPGSVYHMTKSMDQLMFQLYNKIWGMRITDLHQGIVWGAQTELTKLEGRLVNRFDYDGIYGTVLNRFIVQAAVHHPLTVHGTGGQKRAFIHISDSVACVALAVENVPSKDKVRIFNQAAEVLSVREIAELIADKTGVGIDFLPNPRKEREANELEVNNSGLVDLGYAPTRLNDKLLEDVLFVAKQCANKVNQKAIPAKIQWV